MRTNHPIRVLVAGSIAAISVLIVLPGTAATRAATPVLSIASVQISAERDTAWCGPAGCVDGECPTESACVPGPGCVVLIAAEGVGERCEVRAYVAVAGSLRRAGAPVPRARLTIDADVRAPTSCWRNRTSSCFQSVDDQRSRASVLTASDGSWRATLGPFRYYADVWTEQACNTLRATIAARYEAARASWSATREVCA